MRWVSLMNSSSPESSRKQSIDEPSEDPESNQCVLDANVYKNPGRNSPLRINVTMIDTPSPTPNTNVKESLGSAAECSLDVRAEELHEPAESVLEVKRGKLLKAEKKQGYNPTADSIPDSSEGLSPDNRAQDNAEPLSKNEPEGLTTNFDIPRIHLM